MKILSDKQLKIPGMRIAKTVIAVFLCLIVAHFRNNYMENTFFACIAAIISLKGSIEDSKFSSFTRVEGTFIGALVGLLALHIQLWLGLSLNSWAYSAILAVLVGCVLWIMKTFFHSQAATIACISLLSIAINHGMDAEPFLFAYHRFVDTLLGVLIALAINYVLPSPHEQEGLEAVQEDLAAELDEVNQPEDSDFKGDVKKD